jgi:SAM-dependent methyltransferase
MFNVEWLGKIREHEVQYFCGLMRPEKTKILEIGGGTGHQALAISKLGFDITSIDVASSIYADDQVFPVNTYDGKKIPFEDSRFDLVISSNTLEHIRDLDKFQSEICRVLAPDGFCLHAMPTASWRFWTSLTHYVEMFQRLLSLLPRAVFNAPTRAGFRDSGSVLALMARTGHSYLLPPRHGERGNFVTELWYFSRFWWWRHFKRTGFDICSTTPMGLFYTGHMLLNNHMSITLREKLSRVFGSSCVLFEVRPLNQASTDE